MFFFNFLVTVVFYMLRIDANVQQPQNVTNQCECPPSGMASNAGSLTELSTFRNSTNGGTNLSKKHYHSHRQRSFFGVPYCIFFFIFQYLCVWDCISLEEKGGWLISCPVEKIVEKILIEMFRGTKGAIGTVKHLLESLSCLKEITLFAGRDYPTDIFDLVVKMVNLCNGSYRAVVKNASWCVIRLIYEVDSQFEIIGKVGYLKYRTESKNVVSNPYELKYVGYLKIHLSQLKF